MTPKRKEYLAKCSEKELILRHWIKVSKGDIARYKFTLNNDDTLTDDNIKYCLSSIRFNKDRINCWRHKLARLKGMDRVGIPEPYTDYDNLGVGKVAGKIKGVCKCDRFLREFYKYYSKRDRRILWEKVK